MYCFKYFRKRWSSKQQDGNIGILIVKFYFYVTNVRHMIMYLCVVVFLGQLVIQLTENQKLH